MTARIRVVAALLAAFTLIAPAGAGESAASDRVVLSGGDVLFGHVLSESDEAVTLLHAALGEVTIPRDRVMEIALAPASPSVVARTAQAAQAAAIAAASTISLRQPADEPVEEEEPPVKWESRIELGGNGSQGNSDTNSLYASFKTTRTDDLSTFLINMNYRFSSEDGETTTNRFFNRTRFDRLLARDSRWSFFVQSTQELDEFKDYDFRLAGSAGPGYQFIDNDKTNLKGYAGLGVAREFGGFNTDLQFNALFGAALTHHFNDRVTFNGRAEIEPRFDDFGEYRARANASLDVSMNESGSLKLSLGIEDEYNSDPGDAENNDFYYFVALVYGF